jgi:D-3-phosphoglycerate dehydrogenase
MELRGKTIGIIGFGRIGQSLASYALGAGMKVIAVDTSSNSVTINVPIGIDQKVEKIIIPVTDLNEVLNELDFISIHVPKQANGSAVLRAEEFSKMKKGVLIVNASRGGVIDENDLLVALDEGKIGGIALDVYENEPNPRKDLLNHPKIACTPHIGAATLEAQDRIGEELAQLIIGQFGK